MGQSQEGFKVNDQGGFVCREWASAFPDCHLFVECSITKTRSSSLGQGQIRASI